MKENVSGCFFSEHSVLHTWYACVRDVVCAACVDHVDASQVSAGLHVPAPRATQTCTSLHVYSDCLFDRSLGLKSYQTDLNHFSSHGLCYQSLLMMICCVNLSYNIANCCYLHCSQQFN